MPYRYFIKLAYEGSAFNGWQVQPGVPTVQSVLEEALVRVAGIATPVTGCGRTDTGVHARVFYAHADTDKVLDAAACERLAYKLNSYLPKSIAIHFIRPVLPGAHARFSAYAREYEYLVARRKDPFNAGHACHVWGELDITAMNRAAGLLPEYTDFKSFSKVRTQVSSYICKVSHAGWTERDQLLVFTIRADRFLRNMVRAITGTLLDVGRGKLSIEDFREIIGRKDRRAAGYSVPARGLYLIGVWYPDDIWSAEPVCFSEEVDKELIRHHQADSQFHEGTGEEADE
jgi:tRNA pseudouridine38-40 synthase